MQFWLFESLEYAIRLALLLISMVTFMVLVIFAMQVRFNDLAILFA